MATQSPSEGEFHPGCLRKHKVKIWVGLMKIYVKSNFIIPGLDHGECVNLNQSQLTVREFLEEISERLPTRVEFVRPGAQTINPDEWEIRINSIPCPQWSAGLETPLKDEDTVTITIIPLGGG